jgi:hypothetical protein
LPFWRIFYCATSALFPLYLPDMKPKPIALTLLGAIALFASLALPRESVGQAAANDEAQIAQALADVAAQQTVISENQTKIDEKVAAVAEEIRVARIFAGRTGGKTK